jgi:antitoxin (DNA-binding transcriptional repressor) of toxin-antitoxin stability system
VLQDGSTSDAVIATVQSGQRVVLTVHGRAVADIVPHVSRSRWVPGNVIQQRLRGESADFLPQQELDNLLQQTLDD